MEGTHPSNKSYRGRGNKALGGTAAAQTSFVPCRRLSRLPSVLSMGRDVTVAVTPPVTSDFKYERSCRGGGQKHGLPTGPMLTPG